MMSSLIEKVENIKLLIVGPILEKDLGEKVKEKIKGKKWAKYLGEVSHQEAQQMGKPILATNIAGNRAVVTHGVDGFLYKGIEEFEHYAIMLAQYPSLRENMRLSALKATQKYGVEQEISLYEKIYRA